MYNYVKRLVQACPGCSLSNITQHRAADLVYGFPIDAPMRVLFVDIYSAGADLNFDGTKNYLIACCGMTSFSICEPTLEQTAEAFAAALMKIWLRFGFSHTIVVDKASAFLGVFAATAALLNINIHVLSGENHDPMIVESVNRFSTIASQSFAMNEEPIALHSKGSSWLFMPGTLPQSLVLICLAAYLWLATNSNSQSASLPTSIIFLRLTPPKPWRMQHPKLTALNMAEKLLKQLSITIVHITRNT